MIWKLLDVNRFPLWRYRIRIFGSIIGLGIFGYQLFQGLKSIHNGSYSLPTLGNSTRIILITSFALIFQILSWWKLIRSTDKKISLRCLFWGYTSTFLPRYIPGSIWGYWSRSEWLKQSLNMPYRESMIISVFEILLMVLVNIIIGFIFFGVYVNFDTGLLFFFCLILIGIVILIYFRKPLLKKLNLLYLVRTFDIPVGSWLISFSLQTFTWLFYGLGLFLLIEKYISVVDFYQTLFLAIGIYSIAWLMGFLTIFVPAGVGIREIALGSLLIKYGMLNVLSAGGIAVIYRIYVSLSEVIILLIGFVILKVYDE